MQLGYRFTLLILIPSEINGQTIDDSCLIYSYPLYFGQQAHETSLIDIDYFPSSNQVLLGYNQRNLSTQENYGIIIIKPPDQSSVLWANSFPLSESQLSRVKFIDDQRIAFFVIRNGILKQVAVLGYSLDRSIQIIEFPESNFYFLESQKITYSDSLKALYFGLVQIISDADTQSAQYLSSLNFLQLQDMGLQLEKNIFKNLYFPEEKASSISVEFVEKTSTLYVLQTICREDSSSTIKYQTLIRTNEFSSQERFTPIFQQQIYEYQNLSICLESKTDIVYFEKQQLVRQDDSPDIITKYVCELSPEEEQQQCYFQILDIQAILDSISLGDDLPLYVLSLRILSNYIEIYDFYQASKDEYYILAQDSSIQIQFLKLDISSNSKKGTYWAQQKLADGDKIFNVAKILSTSQFLIGGYCTKNHLWGNTRYYPAKQGYLFSNQYTSFDYSLVNNNGVVTLFDAIQEFLPSNQLTDINEFQKDTSQTSITSSTLMQESLQNQFGFDFAFDPSTIIYKIGSSLQGVPISKFQKSDCDQSIYSYKLCDFSGQELIQETRFVFEGQYIWIYATDPNDISEYGFTLQVSNGLNYYLSYQLRVIITPLCWDAKIIAPSETINSTFYYQIFPQYTIKALGGIPTVTYTIPTFASTDSSCSVEYLMLTDLLQPSMNFLTFKDQNLTIKSENGDLHDGTHQANVKIYIENSEYDPVILKFTFVLKHQCYLVPYETYDPFYYKFYYYRIQEDNSEAMIVQYSNFSYENKERCPQIQYILRNNDRNDASYEWRDAIKLYSALSEVHILTTNSEYEGVYKLRLDGYNSLGKNTSTFIGFTLTTLDCTDANSVNLRYENSLEPQTYYIFSSQYTYQFESFTMDYSACGPCIYDVFYTGTSQWTNGVWTPFMAGQESLTDGIHFYSREQELANYDEKTYLSVLRCTLASRLYEETPFQYTMIDPCKYGSIYSDSDLVEAEYYLNQQNPFITDFTPFFKSNVTISWCGVMAYKVQSLADNQGADIADDSGIKLINGTQIQINSKKIYYYQQSNPIKITIKANYEKYAVNGQSHEIVLAYNFLIDCKYEEFTPQKSSISLAYALSDPEVAIPPNSFDQLFSGVCLAPTLFQCTNTSDLSECSTEIFSFDSSTGELIVKSFSDVSFEGTHKLKIKASNEQGVSTYYFIQIEMINHCLGLQIIEGFFSLESSYTHDISEPIYTTEKSLDWTIANSQNCDLQLVYQLVLKSDPSIQLSSEVAIINEETQKLTIKANDKVFVGQYEVLLLATIGPTDKYGSREQPLTIYITDYCANPAFSSIETFEISYIIGRDKQETINPAFTLDPSFCGDIVYQIVDKDDPSHDMKLIDPCSDSEILPTFEKLTYSYYLNSGIFILKLNQFESTEKIVNCGTIEVSVDDYPAYFSINLSTNLLSFNLQEENDLGIYYLNVTASLAGYSLQTSVTLIVIVEISCAYDEITLQQNVLNNLTISYTAGDQGQDIDQLDCFKQKYSSCSYGVTCLDLNTSSICNTKLPKTYYINKISLTSNSLTFETSNNSLEGVWVLEIRADNHYGVKQSYFIITEVKVTCQTTVIEPVGFKNMVSYDVNQYTTEIVQELKWTSSLESRGCGPLSYEASYADGSTLETWLKIVSEKHQLTILIEDEEFQPRILEINILNIPLLFFFSQNRDSWLL